jgi:hypothetical protein
MITWKSENAVICSEGGANGYATVIAIGLDVDVREKATGGNLGVRRAIECCAPAEAQP